MTTQRRRTVLITGGSRGIGLGLAQRCAARGDRVLVTGRSAASLDVVRQLAGDVETVVSDIGSPEDREALALHVAAVAPELDLVINNAGFQRRTPLAADHAPWAERQRELDVLLSGPVHLNHLLVPLVLAHGRPATIVNVTSGGAIVPQPFAPLYSAAKAALHSYTTNLRLALAATPVTVVELIPPAVATELSGLAVAHGVPVEEFCDAALAGIDAGHLTIGYGATDTGPIRDRLRLDDTLFAAATTRSPVLGYAPAVPAGAA